MPSLTTPRVLRCGPFSVRFSPRAVLVGSALLLLVLGLAMVLLGTGSLPIGAGQVLGSLLGQGDSDMTQRIVKRVRLPRVLTGLLVGAALGMAGAIFQSIARNALGSPDVIGFTTGAASGAIVQIIVFDAGPLATALAAVAAGMLTALLVLLLARRGQGSEGYRLVLVGIGMGATLSGLNQLLLVTGDLDQALFAQLWLAGSLNTRTWAHVVPAALGLALILPIALLHGRELALLEMGDNSASQLGVAVGRSRLVLVLAAVGLTAIATAAAGPIAFIALAGPQLARRLTRTASAPLVCAALMGAALLLVADWLSQRLAATAQLPVGLVTGVLGGGYLLWLITAQRKRSM
ncbi:ferric enterobactin transporter FepG [Pseudomonas putida]|nr:ferric enterobactin transporter FepG [Pseudomonas putida]